MEPYLSIVAASRNDDHGGNPLYRTQLFVDGVTAQCDRHRLPAELVLVEWNPPPDRPRLAEVLDWPETEGWCSVRIIPVPNELHRRFEHSEQLPFFQMVAKNVGIRRARGEFVLCTNIDILFSDELMEWIAARRLEHGRAYRVDRHDVPAELDPDWDLDRRLAFCRDSVIRINRRNGTLDTRTGEFFRIYPDRTPAAWLRNDAHGRRLAHSRVGRMLGLPRLAAQTPPSHGLRRLLLDAAEAIRRGRAGRSLWMAAHLTGGVGWRLYAFTYWFVAGFNDPREVPGRIWRRLRRTRATPSPSVASAGGPEAPVDAAGPGPRRQVGSLHEMWELEVSRIRLHTNASGDFTLLAREDWERTRAYPELEMFSMHVDGLFVYQAYYAGIEERFVRHPIFHVEHDHGFKPEPKHVETLNARLAQALVPQLTNEQNQEWFAEMFRMKAPIRFNGDEWGLAGEELDETDPYAESTVGEVNASWSTS